MDTLVNIRGYTFVENIPMVDKPAKPHTQFQERLFDAMALTPGVVTPADLARRCRISPQMAWKWWSGETKAKFVRASDLFRVADALKVRARWLLDGSEPMSTGVTPTPDERRVLDLYRAFQPWHEKWREDWISDGNRVLQNLTQPSSLAHPFPKK